MTTDPHADPHMGGWILPFVGGPLGGQTLDVGHRAACPIPDPPGVYERRQHEGHWVMLWTPAQGGA